MYKSVVEESGLPRFYTYTHINQLINIWATEKRMILKWISIKGDWSFAIFDWKRDVGRMLFMITLLRHGTLSTRKDESVIV